MKTNTVTYLKSSYLSIVIGVLFLVFMVSKTNAQDGKTLFKQSCGVCHTTTQQKLVGPGLEGITTKRKEDWLVKWIKDSQAFVKSGDADAIKAFEDGGKVAMPPFANLSDDQIKSIIAFIGAPPEVAVAAPVAGEAVAVKKDAPLSMGVKMFICAVILILLCIIGYIMMMKRKLRSMGYSFDKKPLGDQIGHFVEQNGRFLVFIAIVIILAVMKTCISHL